MLDELVRLILERLERDAEAIAEDFRTEREVKTRYAVIDDLLPGDVAAKFAPAFPTLEEMRLMKSIREEKRTSKSLDKYDPLLADITFAFQDERIVRKVCEITGFEDAVGDPHLYAGG